MAAACRVWKAVLRSRIFLCGQAVSMLGDGLALLAVPLLVLQLSRSPMAAVLASLPGSVGLPGRRPSGRDHGGPAEPVARADLLRHPPGRDLPDPVRADRISLPSLPGRCWPWPSEPGPSPCSPTPRLAVTVRDVFAGPRLISANSWLESANQGGQIIGPGLAGLLAAAGLLHVSMLIDAITFGVSLATLAWVRRAPDASADSAFRPERRSTALGGLLLFLEQPSHPTVVDPAGGTATGAGELAHRQPRASRRACGSWPPPGCC